jgi:hypothetical protein
MAGFCVAAQEEMHSELTKELLKVEVAGIKQELTIRGETIVLSYLTKEFIMELAGIKQELAIKVRHYYCTLGPHKRISQGGCVGYQTRTHHSR